MLNLAFESEYSALPSPATPESVSLCGPVAGGIGGGRDGGGRVRSCVGYHPEEIPHCWSHICDV